MRFRFVAQASSCSCIISFVCFVYHEFVSPKELPRTIEEVLMRRDLCYHELKFLELVHFKIFLKEIETPSQQRFFSNCIINVQMETFVLMSTVGKRVKWDLTHAPWTVKLVVQLVDLLSIFIARWYMEYLRTTWRLWIRLYEGSILYKIIWVFWKMKGIFGRCCRHQS